MSVNAPRSIDEYLKQLRQALEGQDPALIQDALYDAEEYLRAEVAAHPDKSESDVLELIASTYGAPDEVAAAYRDTEAKVKAALKTPAPRAAAHSSGVARFFGVYQDPRAYTSLFYMLLTLATGIVYFTFVVTGLSLSAGFAVLIIGVPFFLAFIGIARVLALGEGRLLEAMTGERMPRRPLHPGRRRAGGDVSPTCSRTCAPGRRCCTCSSCCRSASSTSPSPSPDLRLACAWRSRLSWC